VLISCFQLYLGCRWFPLFAIVLEFVGLDASPDIDYQVRKLLTFCNSSGDLLSDSQAMILMTFVRYSGASVVSSLFQPTMQIFAYLSFLFASALIILRM
jgi:hypothetical protein